MKTDRFQLTDDAGNEVLCTVGIDTNLGDSKLRVFYRSKCALTEGVVPVAVDAELGPHGHWTGANLVKEGRDGSFSPDRARELATALVRKRILNLQKQIGQLEKKLADPLWPPVK